jgi:hypothetical protein
VVNAARHGTDSDEVTSPEDGPSAEVVEEAGNRCVSHLQRRRAEALAEPTSTRMADVKRDAGAERRYGFVRREKL